MAAPVPFTREQMAAYEAPATTTDTTKASETPEVEATPAAEPVAEETSPEATASDPTESEEGGSEAEDAEAAAAVEPDDSSEEGDIAHEQKKPVPYKRFQEVIDERNALREYGKAMQTAVEELKAAKPEAKPEAATEPTESADASDEPPSLEQFDFDPVAHSVAQAKWLKEQVKKQVAAERQQTILLQEAERVRNEFDARAKEFAKANPAFETVIKSAKLPQLDIDAANALLRSEQGPAILNHLASNMDFATRLAKMTKSQQGYQIGKLEGEFAAKAKPTESSTVTKKRTASNAPPPPKPTPAGSASKTFDALAPNTSMETWVANERARKLQERDTKNKLRQALARR